MAIAKVTFGGGVEVTPAPIQVAHLLPSSFVVILIALFSQEPHPHLCFSCSVSNIVLLHVSRRSFGPSVMRERQANSWLCELVVSSTI